MKLNNVIDQALINNMYHNLEEREKDRQARYERLLHNDQLLDLLEELSKDLDE